MSVRFSRENQKKLLHDALELTRSTGWKSDAVAFSVRRETHAAVDGIGVFQSFGGGSAEFHFGVYDQRILKSVIKGFVTVAFHPRFFNLERLLATFEADNAASQIVALKVGFEFESRVRAGIFNGSDAILMSLSRSDAAKWVGCLS
ncbi:GNAT family N-acetyltransferase [Celeribacter sp.]|uniref:GNAT family N-acetyltransferase n=1 Tax=Celeribacter sp. TaxID=1890673 RepID=UPI003A91545A